MSCPLLAAGALLLLTGCAKKEQQESDPLVPVQVATVRTDSIRRVVTADAFLYPHDQASLMPKISAPVLAFYVNRGDHVRRGQLLAVLENRDLSAAVTESKGQYEQAQAAYRNMASGSVPEEVAKAELDTEAARQALDAAQRVYESREELFRQGALARRLVDEAQVAYVQARSQYQAAEHHRETLQRVGKEEQIKGAAAEVDAAKGRDQGAEAQLEYSQIRSPISGVIAERSVYAGEMANAGTPLITVMNVSSVVARANVSQNQIGYVHVGDSATLTPTDGTSEVAGKVIVVSPAADPGSTTTQVWVEAPNPEERLKPGVAVHVSIVAATLLNAVVIPTEALLPGSDGSSSVFAVGPDSVVHERKVEIGVRGADEVQVLSGVSPGESVVRVGGLGLQDGTKVRVEKPE